MACILSRQAPRSKTDGYELTPATAVSWASGEKSSDLLMKSDLL